MKVFSQLRHKSVCVYVQSKTLVFYILTTTKTMTIYINYLD